MANQTKPTKVRSYVRGDISTGPQISPIQAIVFTSAITLILAVHWKVAMLTALICVAAIGLFIRTRDALRQ